VRTGWMAGRTPARSSLYRATFSAIQSTAVSSAQ
jgi:hypothetical protein